MNQMRSSDTDEVVAFIKSLNECWTKGNVDRLKDYFHKDMVAVGPCDRNFLEGGETCFSSWKKFTETSRVSRWEEQDIKVRLYGDTAIVTYYYDMSFEKDGQNIDTGGRDMYVLHRENGRWWVVADQFSSYPRM